MFDAMPQELIDIVDQFGDPAGFSRSRDEVHKTGLWHRTVHIWVVNRRDQLLLQKRAATKESFPGLWDISAAGHIGAGDTSEQAACRELEEEIGVCVGKGALTFLYTIQGIYEDFSRPFIDHEFSDVYILHKNVDIKKDIVRSDEVDDVRYFGVEELKHGLVSTPDLFVPHYEAYGRLFTYLGSLRV